MEFNRFNQTCSFNFLFSSTTSFVVCAENLRQESSESFSDIVYDLKLAGASESGFLHLREPEKKFEFSINTNKLELDLPKIAKLLENFIYVGIKGRFKIS